MSPREGSQGLQLARVVRSLILLERDLGGIVDAIELMPVRE